jgi:acyclic terpene utilization AtuA family protein
MGAVRIGNFSGYLGDRFTSVDEALVGDPVDVLMGDYLAEVTLAALAVRHRQDSSKGYVDYFLDQLRPHLRTIRERGIKVVANAGGFHPAGLAAALRGEADSAGVALSVAYVDGDNLYADGELARLHAAGQPFTHLDTGADLDSWGVEPIAANAYLGGWGIAAALERGADIVVTGRVTDASLAVGPAAWWHGWGREQWDELAGAVLAGHIIECGAHATGGNFSGFTTIPGMLVPGFPIAEIAADGTSVITKHGRDDGIVSTDTVTAQLLYEIQGPTYLNPDVTVHLDDVTVTQDGPDRVRLSGATGSPAPPTTKVAVFGQIGHQIVNTTFVTAPDVDAKIELLRAQLARDLPEGVNLELTRIGRPAPDPDSQWDATVALRVMAVSAQREPLVRYNLAGRLGSLYLQSIPGYFLDTAAPLHATPRPRIEYWPGLLEQSLVAHRAVLGDGTTVDVPAPAVTAPVTGQPVHPEPEPPPPTGARRRVPLGELAYARCGDKGGNSNVGLWAIDERAWPWLRSALSTEGLRALMPEVKDLDVVRHEFPNLRAVHFVLRGLLGTGGTANQRVDHIGKAVGEYLRAKLVDVPAELLGGPR